MTWHSLPPKARWLFHLQALSRYVFFWIPMTVFAAFMGSGALSVVWAIGIASGWLFVLLIWTLWSPSLGWSRWAWTLRTHDLLVHRGVLVRSTTAVPLARVQHVDTQQGPLEQLFGLVRLTISTASGGGPDVLIPGMDPAQAEALRDQLVQVEGDDGV